MATTVSSTDHSTVIRPDSSSGDSPASPAAHGATSAGAPEQGASSGGPGRGATPPAVAREGDGHAGSGGGFGGVGDAAVAVVALPLYVARTVLGPRRLPVFLGTTALVVLGVIEPPVALGAGLAIEALRRWNPPTSG